MKNNKLFIQTKVYPLVTNTTINSSLLATMIQKFWSEVYAPLTAINKNMHLVLMCKVKYVDETNGYKTLGESRRVNFEDLQSFTEYLTSRVNILNDSYNVLPCSSIEFTYVTRDQIADENRLLNQKIETNVTKHNYNN